MASNQLTETTGLVRVIQERVVPLRGRRLSGSFEEAGVIEIPYLVDGHFECVHPDAMHGLLFVASLLAAHEEMAGRDQGAERAVHLNYPLRAMLPNESRRRM